MMKDEDEKTTLNSPTTQESSLIADEQKGDDKEHSESIVSTHSIDTSDAAADEDSNLLKVSHEAATQEAESIMIGTTFPITTTIEKSPRTNNDSSTTRNFGPNSTSGSIATLPSALPGSNKGTEDSTNTSSLEDHDTTTARRGGPPEDVFVEDDTDGGRVNSNSSHDDHEKQASCLLTDSDVVVSIKEEAQDVAAVVKNEEKEKDRKRIERNKRERMRAKERAKQKSDKNEEMSEEIQKLQKENEQLRKKIELLFDELSSLLPQEKVEVVRQNLSIQHQQESGRDDTSCQH
jgi:hypothetical protein